MSSLKIILDNTSAAEWQIPKRREGRFITEDGTVFQRLPVRRGAALRQGRPYGEKEEGNDYGTGIPYREIGGSWPLSCSRRYKRFRGEGWTAGVCRSGRHSREKGQGKTEIAQQAGTSLNVPALTQLIYLPEKKNPWNFQEIIYFFFT